MSREASRARGLHLAQASEVTLMGYPIVVLYRLPERPPLTCAGSVAPETISPVAPVVAAQGATSYKE